jgi:hypothetical protein
MNVTVFLREESGEGITYFDTNMEAIPSVGDHLEIAPAEVDDMDFSMPEGKDIEELGPLFTVVDVTWIFREPPESDKDRDTDKADVHLTIHPGYDESRMVWLSD